MLNSTTSETDVLSYQPIKSLDNEHGIMLILPLHTCPTTTCRSYIRVAPPSTAATSRAALENENCTLSWCKTNWSSLNGGGNIHSGVGGPDYVFKCDDDGVLTPGLALRYQSKLPFVEDMEEGFVNVTVVKHVSMTQCGAERSFVTRKYNLSETDMYCLSLLYGTSLTENKLLEFMMPSCMAHVWYRALHKLHQASVIQQRIPDRRLQWLKEQYLNLFFEEGRCQGPTAAEAVKVCT